MLKELALVVAADFDRLEQLLGRYLIPEGEEVWEEDFDAGLNERKLEDLIARWPLLWTGIQQHLQQYWNIVGVKTLHFLVLPGDDFLIESIHVVCNKRRFKSKHFVEHAAKRPDVALHRVGQVLPHFRARVARGPCLSIVHPVAGYF